MRGSPRDVMTVFNRLKEDPRQILSMRFNIPDSVDLNDPGAILQHLLNSGQVSQAQVNRMMAMQNNPMIRRLFGM